MEQAMKNMETKSAVNGVNVDELFATIDYTLANFVTLDYIQLSLTNKL